MKFNKEGKLVMPSVTSKKKANKDEFVVKDLFCPNGHSLLSPKAKFNDHDGIVFKVRTESGVEGRLALSPVFGEKIRVSLDVELKDGELLEFICEECGSIFPVHSECSACGGDFKALFQTTEANFVDMLGLCNRVNCPNSKMYSADDLLNMFNKRKEK